MHEKFSLPILADMAVVGEPKGAIADSYVKHFFSNPPVDGRFSRIDKLTVDPSAAIVQEGTCTFILPGRVRCVDIGKCFKVS